MKSILNNLKGKKYTRKIFTTRMLDKVLMIFVYKDCFKSIRK